MKAIFYALSLLVTGAAVFFSVQNKGKFQVQHDEKIETLDKNKILDGKKAKQQTALEAEQLALETANREREAKNQAITTLRSKAKQTARDITELDSDLAEQKAKFAELEKIKAEVAAIMKDVGDDVNMDNLAQKVQEVEADRLAKEKALEELKNGVAVLEKDVAKNQEEISRLADRDVSRDKRIRGNAMESVVTAVNDDWGFVIIGAGSNTGFTPQTKLLIKREGRLIGEVKPSSVEPSQTIAEIDADTIAPGARIQPGDRVILADPATN